MTFFRYRRPSLNTLLGITKAKKRIKKELGITEAIAVATAFAGIVR